ncbi:MAG: polyprenyl synthetase family protein [Pseudomonadota bacterium]|nr:polyprenyl synthetase family protein [Pseudomonadota bacterium]
MLDTQQIDKAEIFNAIQSLVTNELELVENELANVQSDVKIINEISSHILRSGGKRLRPMLVLLSAGCFDYHGTKSIKLASIVEMIHAATLMHDDVIDNSSKRRSKATANFIWDNKFSILAGDYIYAHSFQKMTELNSLKIFDILAAVTAYIVEGEIIQLKQNQDISVTLADYLQVIDRKTAKLFSVSSQLGAVVAGESLQVIQTMEKFGHYFGLAYQMINDILDYTDNIKITGKEYAEDLLEGKPTLPLIKAYECSNTEDRSTLKAAFENNPDISLVEPIIAKTLSIKKSHDYAKTYINKARNCLEDIPKSTYKSGLLELCDYLELMPY